MEKIRAFIAIDFPDAVVKEVARIGEILQGQKFVGKLTELENLHLTLKFLGEIDEGKVDEVRKVLQEIEFREFEAKLGEIGTFKHHGVPSIVWIKVGGKGIFELQSLVDAALGKVGFVREKRFMSHLTVARVKYVKAKREFVDYISGLGVKSLKWNVGSFKLMKSELKPIGPEYNLIEEFRF